MTPEPPPFICQIAQVHDDDTIRCKDGSRIRLAAIDANELDGTCHRECAPMSAVRARDYLARRIGGRTITFRIVGVSGKRLVGENYALRCELVRVGAAVRWERFERGYGLEGCR